MARSGSIVQHRSRLARGTRLPSVLGISQSIGPSGSIDFNNIAEGFERLSTKELVGFLGIARASAGEVRSMISAVHQRGKLAILREQLLLIRESGESCARQITAWIGSIENSPVKGKRYQQSIPETEPSKRAKNLEKTSGSDSQRGR